MRHRKFWASCDVCGRDTPPFDDECLMTKWMLACQWSLDVVADQTRVLCDKCARAAKRI